MKFFHHIWNIVFVIHLIQLVSKSMCSDMQKLKLQFLEDFFQNVPDMRYDLCLCWSNAELMYFRNLASTFQISLLSEEQFLKSSKVDHVLIRVLDLDCTLSQNVLIQANITKYFARPNKWLLLLNKDKHERNIIFNTLAFETDSDIITVTFDSSNTAILEQPYKYNLNAQHLIFEEYGYWLNRTIIDRRSTKIMSYRRKDLHGVGLRTPYVSIHPDTPNELPNLRYTPNDAATKQTYHVNLVLAWYVNASLVTKKVDSWGRPLPNGSWTGVIAELINGEADIAGTSLLLFPERFPYVRYLSKNSKTRLTAIFRKPPLSYVNNIFRLSFRGSVWFSLLLLSILTLVIAKLSFFWEVRYEDNEDNQNSVMIPLEDKWSSIVLFIMGAVCQQGAEMEPRGLSGRIVGLFVFLSMMFMYVSYSANIISLLQSTSSELRSVSDLVDTRLQIGVIDLEYGRTMFQKTVDPVRKAIYKRKLGPEGFYPLANAVKKVRDGLFVFIGEPGPTYYYITRTFQESEKCDLDELYNFGVSLATFNSIPKNSSYTEIFKVAFNKIEEFGLLQRSFSRLYVNKPQCTKSTINFISVGLIDCYFVFVVWGSGIGLAFFLYVIETVLAFKNRWRVQDKTITIILDDNNSSTFSESGDNLNM